VGMAEGPAVYLVDRLFIAGPLTAYFNARHAIAQTPCSSSQGLMTSTSSSRVGKRANLLVSITFLADSGGLHGRQ
ncbi:MAG: hypothetical protein OXI72_15140, partial [Gemmatimonadota bacterium]|nr:hypothetical protein [Gemmatimonadota bacterium]